MKHLNLAILLIVFAFAAPTAWPGQRLAQAERAPDEPRERVTLNAPVKRKAGFTTGRVTFIGLDIEHKTVECIVREVKPPKSVPDPNNPAATILMPDYSGEMIVVRYSGKPALALMRLINNGAFAPPLNQALLEKFIADGKLPGGTVTLDQ